MDMDYPKTPDSPSYDKKVGLDGAHFIDYEQSSGMSGVYDFSSPDLVEDQYWSDEVSLQDNDVQRAELYWDEDWEEKRAELYWDEDWEEKTDSFLCFYTPIFMFLFFVCFALYVDEQNFYDGINLEKSILQLEDADLYLRKPNVLDVEYKFDRVKWKVENLISRVERLSIRHTDMVKRDSGNEYMEERMQEEFGHSNTANERQNDTDFEGWYGHSLVAQLQEYKPNEGKDLEDTLCEDINYIKQRLSNTAKGQATFEAKLNQLNSFLRNCLFCPEEIIPNKELAEQVMKVNHVKRISAKQRKLILQNRYFHSKNASTITSRQISTIITNRPVSEQMHKKNREGLPVVSVVVKIEEDLSNPLDSSLMSFFTSFSNTLEKGFEYWFVLCSDYDNKIIGLKNKQEEINRSFMMTVGEVASRLGIPTQLKFIFFDNPSDLPGPALNVAAGSAYYDGTDYVFAVDQDVVPPMKWSSKYSQILNNNKPRSFGVIHHIPNLHDQIINAGITHMGHFVGRTHFGIFKTFVPVSLLEDDLINDWLLNTYGDRDETNARHERRKSDVITSPLIEKKKAKYCLKEYELFSTAKKVKLWLSVIEEN